MLASRFGVDMHVATIDIAAARNLMLAVERCHLDVEAMVASPYVAGLSVLADDEADLGSAVVDMGAGTTTMAAFLGGRLVYVEGFALGGHHVTMDIARGLNARVSDAERIKTLYGTVLSGGSDERDMITVPPLSDDEREQAQLVSRATLVNIIKPRVEEILEMVRDRLASSPLGGRPARPCHSHRRRKPAHRICRIWRRAFSAARCASVARSALPARRTRPKARLLPWRPVSSFTRKRRISSTSSRGASGNS